MTHLIAIILLITAPVWIPVGFVSIVVFCLLCSVPKLYRALHSVVVEFKEALWS
jgi:hypothetical protein